MITGKASKSVDVGSVDDFPVGQFRVITLDGGLEVGVLRQKDERWVAVRNACPHHLAPICAGQVSGTMLPREGSTEFDYGMEGSVLRCPWHGYEYDLETGKPVLGVAPGRLRLFEAGEQDGRVVIKVKERG